VRVCGALNFAKVRVLFNVLEYEKNKRVWNRIINVYFPRSKRTARATVFEVVLLSGPPIALASVLENVLANAPASAPVSAPAVSNVAPTSAPTKTASG
jgi:hypothetical protein